MEQISLKEFKLIKLNIFFNFKFQIYENFQVFEFINIFTKLSNNENNTIQFYVISLDK